MEEKESKREIEIEEDAEVSSKYSQEIFMLQFMKYFKRMKDGVYQYMNYFMLYKY